MLVRTTGGARLHPCSLRRRRLGRHFAGSSLARRRAYGTCAALVLRLLLSFAGHRPITFNGTLNVSSALKSESSAVVGLRRSITTDRRCWNYSASMMQTQR